MAQQKALLIIEKQGDLAVRDIAVYKPEPGEILIEVQSAGLNPIDWKIAKLGYFVTTYPAVGGFDSAGIVKELGEGVTKFKVDDRVFHLGSVTNRLATFQQYTTIPAELAVKLPSNLSFDEGASIPLALVTAAYGLYSKFVRPPARGGAELTPYWEEGGRGKYAGQPIVILGGASAVGQQAIQLARLSGFSPIITTASPHNASFLISLGATHFIDRSAPLASSISAITSESITLIYDAISVAETQNSAWDLLAPGGKLIVVMAPAIDGGKLEEGRNNARKEVVFVLASVHDKSQGDLGVKLYEHVTAALESGDIKPNKVEVLPNGLAGIPGGLDKLRLNKVSGTKLVAHPQETV